MTQNKVSNNECNFKAWLNNELVLTTRYPCKNYNDGIGLYIAGIYHYYFDGQVRNFSYIPT